LQERRIVAVSTKTFAIGNKTRRAPIDRDATRKASPASTICRVPAKEGSKTEWKHAGQRPIFVAVIRRKKRG
jgi:hypothetical protein